MNGTDRKKLLKSGHRVMRANEHNLTITELLTTGGWGIVERFETKAALQRGITRFREESEKTVFEFDSNDEDAALEAQTENQLTLIMTKEEAEKKHAQIKSLTTVIRALFFEMRDRRGWQALGFASFEEYGAKEFGYSSSHLYRLASAYEVEQSLNSPTGEIPETHLRPLAPLTEEARQEIWAEATKQAEESGKKMTAKLIEEAVAEYKLKNEQLKEGLTGLLDEMDNRAEEIANEKIEREKERLQSNIDQIALQLESDYAARVDSQSDVILRLKNELALLKESKLINSPTSSASETSQLEKKIQALNDDIARLTQVKKDTLQLQNINTKYQYYAKEVITIFNEFTGLIDGFISINKDAEFEGIKAHKLLDDETKRLLKEAIDTLGYAKGRFIFMLTNSSADYDTQQSFESIKPDNNDSKNTKEPAKPATKKIKPLPKASLDELIKISNGPIVTSYINPGIVNLLFLSEFIEFEMMPSPFKSHKGAEIQHAIITQSGIDYLASVTA